VYSDGLIMNMNCITIFTTVIVSCF